MFNKDGNDKEHKGWFARRREEKEKREAMMLLNLRLNTADDLYNMALDLESRNTRADKMEALRGALVASETYQEAVQYDPTNYMPLFKCQRLISSIYSQFNDYENAYKYARDAIENSVNIGKYNLAKGHQYAYISNAFYELALLCANLGKEEEATINYYRYIFNINYVLSYYPEEMNDITAEFIRESARMLTLYRPKFSNEEFDDDMVNSYKTLLNEGTKYFTLASDVANYYALSDYQMGVKNYKKSMDLLNSNYKQIRQFYKSGKTYNKMYFDLVFTSCNLQSLNRQSKNTDFANKLSDVVIRFLPKAIETYKTNFYENSMINVNKKYEYIIDTMKKEYVPTLPAEKQKEVMKTLNSCLYIVKDYKYIDFDI